MQIFIFTNKTSKGKCIYVTIALLGQHRNGKRENLMQRNYMKTALLCLMSGSSAIIWFIFRECIRLLAFMTTKSNERYCKNENLSNLEFVDAFYHSKKRHSSCLNFLGCKIRITCVLSYKGDKFCISVDRINISTDDIFLMSPVKYTDNLQHCLVLSKHHY